MELTRFVKYTPGFFSDRVYDEELEAEVKPEFWEIWMTLPREKRKRAKLEKWLTKLGLPIWAKVAPM